MVFLSGTPRSLAEAKKAVSSSLNSKLESYFLQEQLLCTNFLSAYSILIVLRLDKAKIPDPELNTFGTSSIKSQ